KIDERRHIVLEALDAAALGIGRIDVGAAAEHELAAIRLTDVHGTVQHHIEHGLYGLGHHGLQRHAGDGQRQAELAREERRATRDRYAHTGSEDRAARRLDPRDRAARDAKARHLALLDDIDAERVRGASVCPGDRIVTHHTAAALD